MGSVNAGVRVSSGRTTFSATIPYLFVDSPGLVYSGFDGTPLVMLADTGGERRSWSSIGDPTFSLSHDIPMGQTSLRGAARIKIPVQGFNSISTGQLDWSVSAEISHKLGAITPFASLGYRSFGDTSAWRVRDGFSGSVGLGASLSEGAIAVSYEMAESTSDFVGDAHELVAVYDRSIGGRVRLALFGTIGLSDGAADGGGGVRVSLAM